MSTRGSTVAAKLDHINDVLHRIELSHSEKLDQISKQVKETNGRVKVLEIWRAQIQGGSMVAKFIWGAFGVSLIGVFVHFYNVIDSIEKSIASEVTAQISTLEFNITE